MTGLYLSLGMREALYSCNFAIENPELTSMIRPDRVFVEEIIERGKLPRLEKMIQAESLLFSKWKYNEDWRKYLDSPLLAHADAALSLKNQGYNAAIGIEEAGIPYNDIFRIMGLQTFAVDYSHHKRKMDEPSISQEDLKELKNKKIVLVDVDFVTGRTLRKVINHLYLNNINIDTVYLGLSEWPGIGSDAFCIDGNAIDFEKFWKTCGSLKSIKDPLPYSSRIIPKNVRVITSDSTIGEDESKGSSAAVRIAKYFQRIERKQE